MPAEDARRPAEIDVTTKVLGFVDRQGQGAVDQGTGSCFVLGSNGNRQPAERLGLVFLARMTVRHSFDDPDRLVGTGWGDRVSNLGLQCLRQAGVGVRGIDQRQRRSGLLPAIASTINPE